MKTKNFLIFPATALALLTLAACGSGQASKTPPSPSSSSSSSVSSSSSSTSESSSIPESSSSSQERSTGDYSILQQLLKYTNEESPGVNKNYYLTNGDALLNGFENMAPGSFLFSSDSQGRSSTARAVLTYSDYESSKGGRQGTPLAPPGWLHDNPKVAIDFSLTGKTYHGFLYNRSHSIADSLLGKKSYTSAYNFTTGTRSQNVGANEKGGMRAAELLAENYWKNHPGTSNTIDYMTRPVYQGEEKVPRGSIVDVKSSDGEVNQEIIVINDAEGIKIDYMTGEMMK